MSVNTSPISDHSDGNSVVRKCGNHQNRHPCPWGHVLGYILWLQTLIWPVSVTAMVSAMSWASCQMRKLRVAHATGMPGTFSPPPRVRYPDMHHGTCVTFPAFPAHEQPTILRICYEAHMMLDIFITAPAPISIVWLKVCVNIHNSHIQHVHD